MRRAYIILIIAVVVAAVVWVFERPYRDNTSDIEPFFISPGITGKDVSGIDIEHLISGSRLEKKGDEWAVSELTTEMGKQIKKEEGGEEPPAKWYKADMEKVGTTLKKLEELKASSLVSTNPEKQAAYQVGNLAKHVKVYDSSGNKLVDLYIGKEGPDMFTTYVRRDGEDEVYLAGGHIGAEIPADPMSWRDKRIWEIDPGSVIAVNVEKDVGKDAVKYSLSGGGREDWSLSKPQETPLDKAKITKFLENICNLTASRFAHELDVDKAGLKDPSLRLEIVTKDGRGHLLIVGAADKQGYIYAGASDSGDIYLLDSNFGSKIPSDWSEFLPAGK